MRVDHTRRPARVSLLVAIGAFGFAALLWQMAQNPPAAVAQIQDAGAQRASHIAELREINKQLAAITKILGEIRDQHKADDDKPPAAPQTFRPPK